MSKNFALIIILVGFSAVAAYERVRSGEAARSAASRSPQSYEWSTTEPKAGMSLKAFKGLCGPPTSADVSTSSYSEGRKSAFLKYHPSTERDKTNCSGMFSFMDDELIAISR